MKRKIGIAAAILLACTAVAAAFTVYEVLLKEEEKALYGAPRITAPALTAYSNLPVSFAPGIYTEKPNRSDPDLIAKQETLLAEKIQERYANAKLIAITFDDGPGRYTDGLLDALKERDVRVTFMVLGECAQRYPDVLSRAVAEGHQIGCHSWGHPQFAGMSEQEIRREIEDTNALIREAGYDRRIVVRPPYGQLSETIKKSAGGPIILWDVDTEDWRLKGKPNRVRDNILRDAHDGAVVLLHDIYESSVEGAIMAIDRLKEEGYRFVTVDELFEARGIPLKNGVKYREATP